MRLNTSRCDLTHGPSSSSSSSRGSAGAGAKAAAAASSKSGRSTTNRLPSTQGHSSTFAWKGRACSRLLHLQLVLSLHQQREACSNRQQYFLHCSFESLASLPLKEGNIEETPSGFSFRVRVPAVPSN